MEGGDYIHRNRAHISKTEKIMKHKKYNHLKCSSQRIHKDNRGKKKPGASIDLLKSMLGLVTAQADQVHIKPYTNIIIY